MVGINNRNENTEKEMICGLREDVERAQVVSLSDYISVIRELETQTLESA